MSDFLPGDQVLHCPSSGEARRGVVLDVEPLGLSARVQFPGDDPRTCMTSALYLLAPPRRAFDDDALDAIHRGCIARALAPVTRLWMDRARALSGEDVDDATCLWLLEGARTLTIEMYARGEADYVEAAARYRAELGALPDDEKVARWAAEHRAWTDGSGTMDEAGSALRERSELVEARRRARKPYYLEAGPRAAADLPGDAVAAAVADASRSTALWVRGFPVRDLARAAELPRLAELVVDANHGLDLTQLQGCAALRALALRVPVALDLAPLRALPALTKLTLWNVPDVDLGAVASLPALETFVLASDAIDDLAPFAGSPVRELFLHGVPVRELPPLPQLRKLRAVDTDLDLPSVRAARPELQVLGGDSVNDTPDPGPIPDRLEDLRAECAALEAQPHDSARFHRSTALWIARVATGDPAELAAFVAKNTGEEPTALITGSDVDAVLAARWAPIAHLAPAFVARLRRDVLALAHLGTSLGYVLMWDHGRYQLGGRRLPRRRDLAHLREWTRRGSLTVVVADPPRDIPTFVEVDALEDPLPVPLALRELYRVHDGWRSGMSRLEGATRLASLRLYREGREAEFQERNDGRLPTTFVKLTDNGSGDGDVLDLEELDGRGDPMVRGFDHGTWGVGSQALPFWTWFEGEMPEAFLRHDRDWGWMFWGAAYGPRP